MIDAGVEMSLRIERPCGYNLLGDFGRLVEHPELMIFGRQKIEAAVVLRMSGDLLFQNPDVPEVSLPSSLRIGSELVVNADAGADQPSAALQDGGVDRLMDPAAIAILGAVWKQTNEIVRRGAGFEQAVQALEVISCVFVARDQFANQRR